MQPWIAYLGTIVLGFMDKGLWVANLVRCLLWSPLLLVKSYDVQIYIGYIGWLISAHSTISVLDLAAISVWTMLSIRHIKSDKVLIIQGILFFIFTHCVSQDAKGMSLAYVICVFCQYRYMFYYDKCEEIKQIENTRQLEIEKLKKDLKKIKSKEKYEKFVKNSAPKIPSQLAILIEKLRSMKNTITSPFGSDRDIFSIIEQLSPNLRGGSANLLSPNLRSGPVKDFTSATLKFDLLSADQSAKDRDRIDSVDEEQLGQQPESPLLSLPSIGRRWSIIRGYHTLSDEEIDMVISALMNKDYIMNFEGEPGENLHATMAKHKDEFANFENNQLVRHLMSIKEENSAIGDLLEGVGEWNYDTFLLNSASRKSPLKEIGTWVFTTLGLVEKFRMPNEKLTNFLTDAEAQYRRDVYYHNGIHAADVVNSMIYLLHNGLMARAHLSDIELAALIIGAMTQDMGHRGVSNAFLVASSDPLAIKYNEQSVLEHMHCSLTFKLLSNESSSIFENSPTQMPALRKILIAIILATDLQKHFEILQEFHCVLNSQEGYNAADESHKLLALKICLKCADLGHTAKKLSIHKAWTSFVVKELFKQGDTEAKLGLPVSPLCDRAETNWQQFQVGKLRILALPLFETWEDFIDQGDEDYSSSPEYRIWSKQIIHNIQFWENEMEKQTFWLDHAPPMSLLPKKISSMRSFD